MPAASRRPSTSPLKTWTPYSPRPDARLRVTVSGRVRPPPRPALGGNTPVVRAPRHPKRRPGQRPGRSALLSVDDRLVVVDDLFDHEVEELLGERRVESGLVGEGAQTRDLGLLARGVRRRHTSKRLELTHLLGALETLREQVHQGSI